ncbi:MAG: hypothetical protein QXT84_00975 [Candidatus Bathyarchaeia archaeon]
MAGLIFGVWTAEEASKVVTYSATIAVLSFITAFALYTLSKWLEKTEW